MSTTVQTRIKLRNDSEENFNKVASTLIPLNGELLVVRTTNYGIKFKIGDGTSNYQTLKFIDNDSSTKLNLIRGYYFENSMYVDNAHTLKLECFSYQLYFDNSTGIIYRYDDTNKLLISINSIPTASESTAGIVKLYKTHGQNEDGTITQKLFTDSIDNIYFAVSENEGDDDFTLYLNKPW